MTHDRPAPVYVRDGAECCTGPRARYAAVGQTKPRGTCPRTTSDPPGYPPAQPDARVTREQTSATTTRVAERGAGNSRLENRLLEVPAAGLGVPVVLVDAQPRTDTAVLHAAARQDVH